MSDAAKKFSHYHKPCPYDTIDVYRVLKLFEVHDPCIQHAVKKLLVAGHRGSKSKAQDVSEAITSLARFLEMDAEEISAMSVEEIGKLVSKKPTGVPLNITGELK